MCVWSAVIAARLYSLHIVRADEMRERALAQQQDVLTVTPRRGVISDRNGSELAVSVKVDSVAARPREIRDPEKTAAILAGLTGRPAAALLKDLRSEKGFVWIKRKISPAETAAIQRAKLPGIHFQQEDRRFYPKRQLAAHVLGFVNIDEEGMSGLEYAYNASVRGEPGRVGVMRDARREGNVFSSWMEQTPQAGANLITTLDENIQHIVETEIRAAVARTAASGMSIAVMDPNTGEILAMANHPTFNPNEYRRYKETTWINRAVSHTYEPGSTFKIATIAAALEEGLTTPEEQIDCLQGSIVIHGHRINDHKSFGVLSVTEIMQYSSDVGVIKLGLRLGDERFAGYIHRLGFGRLTEVDLPGEEVGQTKPASQWSRVSVGAISMGQEIAVTPLQILSLASAVANGGVLYRPYVVKRVEHPQRGVLSETQPRGDRIFSIETAGRLQQMLEAVVSNGTGKAAALDLYRAAGKTGTAQKIDETGRYSRTKHVASFVGYAPASNPAISIIVVVDEPVGLYHGGDVAAPIFKKIAEQILRYRAVAPDVPWDLPRYVPAPSKPSHEEGETSAADWRVVDAAVKPAGESGTSALQPGEIETPDFYGKSLRQASEEALRLGLRLKSAGSGRAVAQHPPPGSRLRPGTRVQVEFSVR